MLYASVRKSNSPGKTCKTFRKIKIAVTQCDSLRFPAIGHDFSAWSELFTPSSDRFARISVSRYKIKALISPIFVIRFWQIKLTWQAVLCRSFVLKFQVYILFTFRVLIQNVTPTFSKPIPSILPSHRQPKSWRPSRAKLENSTFHFFWARKQKFSFK